MTQHSTEYKQIKMICLGSMGSEVATIMSRYQRGGKRINLSNDDKKVLDSAIIFVENIRKGYDGVVNISKFSMDPEAPASYNLYLRVRQQLPELGLVKKVEQIEEEINMFSNILKKLNKTETLNEKEMQGVNKVRVFFSELGNYMLEKYAGKFLVFG